MITWLSVSLSSKEHFYVFWFIVWTVRSLTVLVCSHRTSGSSRSLFSVKILFKPSVHYLPSTKRQTDKSWRTQWSIYQLKSSPSGASRDEDLLGDQWCDSKIMLMSLCVGWMCKQAGKVLIRQWWLVALPLSCYKSLKAGLIVHLRNISMFKRLRAVLVLDKVGQLSWCWQ